MTLRESLNEIINELSVGYSEELLESAENLHGNGNSMQDSPDKAPKNWEGMNVKKKLHYLFNELSDDNLRNLLDHARELHWQEARDLLEAFHKSR